MTIRDALHQMLAGMGTETDPAQLLADYGFEGITPEMFGTVLAHLSDQAPIELADSLSPLVTRVSDIPYDDHEMPPLPDGLALTDVDDLYRLLEAQGLASFSPDGLYDNTDPSAPDGPELPDLDLGLPQIGESDEIDFGSGSDAAPDQSHHEPGEDPLTDDDADYEPPPLASAVEPDETPFDDFASEFEDFDPFEFDDTDPADLDFG